MGYDKSQKSQSLRWCGEVLKGDKMKKMKKRLLLVVSALVFIVLILDVLTGRLTFHHPIVFWDGGYPSNQFRIRVTDSKGIPIAAATLGVVTKSNEPVYGYPIEEFSEESQPQADNSGTIVVHHTGGIEFGGSYRLLFGVIRWPPSWSDTLPEYYLHITAQGYRKKSLRYGDLMNYECTVDSSPKVIRQVERRGKIVNVSYGVVEKTVVLKRK